MNPKYDPQREVIARAIVVEDGAFVVNKSRNTKTGEEYFALPGGHVDPGESCVAALEREWQEELGGKLEVLDLCFVAESVYSGRKKEDSSRHELVLFFHANLASPLQHNGKEISSPETGKNFQWLRFEDLDASNLLPKTVKEFLLDTLEEIDSSHYAFSDSTRN
jgi:ADP-ribose pyrophosphatase YjhB (NUDIX family)